MNLSEIETRVKSIISVNNSEDLQTYITKFIDEILTKNNNEWSQRCSEWMTKHEQIWNECLSANNKIAELEKLVPQWINVYEKLPIDNQHILYTVTGENIRKGIFLLKDQWNRENMFCDGASFLDKSFISYWMPLPDKPILTTEA